MTSTLEKKLFDSVRVTRLQNNEHLKRQFKVTEGHLTAEINGLKERTTELQVSLPDVHARAQDEPGGLTATIQT
jgi:hypothetical protein